MIMKKIYRIKEWAYNPFNEPDPMIDPVQFTPFPTPEDWEPRTISHRYFTVQMHKWWGWSDIKVFHDPFDADFARWEAEELLDKLNED